MLVAEVAALTFLCYFPLFTTPVTNVVVFPLLHNPTLIIEVFVVYL
jgi:hypothetical protein